MAAGAEPSAEDLKLFETKIRPVLVERCYKCHSADAVQKDNLQGELLLDTREGIRKGGASGPAIVPGDVAKSLLITAIRHESFEMPPQSKLPKETIDHFVKWVESGGTGWTWPASPRATATPLTKTARRRFTIATS